ncbi:SLOG family protein [Flavonifractor hominis]|uniref:SLOG family protein n=1 Tax=Flavonifractor hominis TaxID=3133178 RepID=A0ABV1ENW7_9FIRM
MDRERTCSFTGHRPEKLPWRENEQDPRCLALKARLVKAVEQAYDEGVRHFLCGMARGADFYFCEAVLELRRKCAGVTLEAVIPCEEQAAHWRERDRERYFSLVERCDRETMIQRHYDRGCMLRRNRYLVDHAGMLIAVYDGMLGGTMYTISYAMKQGRKIVTLDVEE